MIRYILIITIIVLSYSGLNAQVKYDTIPVNPPFARTVFPGINFVELRIIQSFDEDTSIRGQIYAIHNGQYLKMPDKFKQLYEQVKNISTATVEDMIKCAIIFENWEEDNRIEFGAFENIDTMIYQYHNLYKIKIVIHSKFLDHINKNVIYYVDTLNRLPHNFMQKRNNNISFGFQLSDLNENKTINKHTIYIKRSK